jgi:hypothetical protein
MREPAPSSSTIASNKTLVDINTFIQKSQDREDDLRRQFALWDMKPDVSAAPSVVPSKREGKMSNDEVVDHV